MRWLVPLLLLAVACGDDDADGEARPPRERSAEPAPSPDEPVADPLEGLAEPATPDEITPPLPTNDVASPGTQAAAVPDRGCVALTDLPVKVWPTPGPSAIVTHGSAFVVAGYDHGESGEALWLVQLAPDTPPRPLRRLPVTPASSIGRIAPPALASAGLTDVFVALVDGRGHVRATAIPTGDPLADVSLAEIGDSADPRFAPAAAATSRHRLVAWTDGSGTPMRVRLAVLGLDGTVASRHDVTPQAMGASAPAFGTGMSPPALFFLDAREGVSPIVRVPIGADGAPREAAVARPVGTVTSPPRLAVAQAGGHAWAGYTAIGNAAATAVGFVPLDTEDASPAAIVPGTGYGPLHVSVAAGPGAVVFAADAPTDDPEGGPVDQAPRVVHVRVVDRAGAGSVLALHAPDGTGRYAAIARRSDGVLGVAMTAGDGVYVAWLRCDDGGGGNGR